MMNTIVNEKLVSFKELEKNIFAWICQIGRCFTKEFLERYDRMLMENPKISENWSLATEKKEKAGCHRHGMFLVPTAV